VIETLFSLPRRRLPVLAVTAFAALALASGSIFAAARAKTSAPAAAPAPAPKTADLLRVLESADAPLFERARACQQLTVFGTAEAVPVLAKLLADEKLGHYAREALEGMASPAADAALRESLGRLQGHALIGAVTSIGFRRDEAAVPALLKLAADPAAPATPAAMIALGRIATPPALAALRAALTEKTDARRVAAAEAALMAAGRLAKSQKADEAKKFYDEVRAAKVPDHVRLPAWRGALLTRGAAGLGLLREALRSSDDGVRAIGLGVLRELPGAEVLPAMAAELGKLDATMRPLVVEGLADRAEPGALAYVERWAAAPEAPIRLAALRALGKIGRDSSLPALFQALGSANEVEAEAAQRSLVSLRAPGIDSQIQSRLSSVRPPQLLRVINLAAQRNLEAAAPALLQLGSHADSAVRLASWRALGLVAVPAQVPDLIRLLLAPADTGDRALINQAVIAACGKITPPDQRTAPLEKALVETTDPAARAVLEAPLRALRRLQEQETVASPKNAKAAKKRAATPAAATRAAPAPVVWEKITVTTEFVAEGCAAADFDRDGHIDVTAGRYIWFGPDFKRRAAFTPERNNPKGPTKTPYDPATGYSDYFLAFAHDFNGDGWPDIFVYELPGEPAYLYLNPGKQGGDWPKHAIFDVADNESPDLKDVNGDGKPEILSHTSDKVKPKGPASKSGGQLGFGEIDWKNPTAKARFRAITPKTPENEEKYFRYTHGYGAGDVNGDGRIDLITKDGWFEQPASLKEDSFWKFHPGPFAPAGAQGGAQMFVYDVNGDKRADIITSYAAHSYGLGWFEQRPDGTFREHRIMGRTPAESAGGVVFSQVHAVLLLDVDGDGLQDIVAGKRRWAHGPNKDDEPNAAPVLYWFKLTRDGKGGATYAPHLIDNDSGVGMHIATADFNRDGKPDLAIANKKGVFVFRQK
jgi:HEAT repeat protein